MLADAAAALGRALEGGGVGAVARSAQRVADGVCRHFAVDPVRVDVASRRPHGRGGELHGLYEEGEPGGRDRITVWMFTAKRGQVVAYKTFLRTLVHELCHHLDYTVLGLGESLHTPGFYQRESALYEALYRAQLTRREAVPMNPTRAEARQLPLGLGAPAPEHPQRDDGHREHSGPHGQRARQRERGAGEVLGKA